MFIGTERLIDDGRELPYSMLDFWRSSYSQILLNMNRGTFAEFLVKCSMMEHGYDAICQSKSGTEPWDIDGPQLHTSEGVRRCRIEVKSCASVQLSTPDESEPIILPDTELTFSIKPSIIWEDESAGPRRNNDLYVFAHYTAQYKACNMLDMRFWDYYVYPTFKIEADAVLEKQKTISVYRLKKLGVSVQSFDTLYPEILRVISEISEHFS